MNEALEELNNKLNGKVDFFSYKAKDSASFITSSCRSAMIDDEGVEIKNNLVVIVLFQNNDLFEFAFDDFEYKGEYIKFYNKNAVLTLRVKN